VSPLARSVFVWNYFDTQRLLEGLATVFKQNIRGGAPVAVLALFNRCMQRRAVSRRQPRVRLQIRS
jgi:hypothetical protein